MAGKTPVGGSNINVPNPLPSKQTASNNYLDFATGWAQQYLPELYEQEVERYGNRMLSGFLAQVGAEEAMASDRVRWSEQGRLHISKPAVAGASGHAAANKVRFSTTADGELFRKNDTVLLYALSGTGAGESIKGIVTTEVDGSKDVVIVPYTQATLGTATFGDDTVYQVMVYGSEFKKGSSLGANGTNRNALTPGFNSYENKPIIIRDRFIVNGSDAAQIGWVEVSGESGQSGYLWYLKAEGDTRSRFNDYLEMSMIEAERATGTQLDTFLGTGGANTAEAGTEGLFAAIEDRGHVVTDALVGTYADDLETFDNILIKFDGQGAIEENMLYLDRFTTLKIDDMLGALNRGESASASFGVFNNSGDMAVNLGFNGFRRGSYDFYKTDWKYLNDAQAHGANTPAAGDNKIAGAIIPAGVSTVYDEGMGRNIKRPFLHVRYRASETEDRKMKSWITGSVGGNITSDEDAMIVNYLSERCLVVQAANNFMLLKR